MSERPHVLIVDDDREIRSLLAQYLEKHDCRSTAVADGKEMRRVLERSHVDLVVLDLMLPGEDGLSLCRELRGRSQMPIIMLTARGEDVDRIIGLELGADDYVAKPFNPRELLARIRAVLRRGRSVPAAAPRFRAGDLQIDFAAREVTMAGARLTLTTYEFDLLATLARAAGRVLSREQLLDALKGTQYESFDRSIDVHVSNLRAKIEANPKAPRYLKTIRGVGYVLLRED